jgi:hypothetical protein
MAAEKGIVAVSREAKSVVNKINHEQQSDLSLVNIGIILYEFDVC